MSDTAMLDEADACHDDDPAAAAGLLRALDAAALPPERWPGLAFLFNHVLGEKLMAWPEAHAKQQSLLALAGATPPAALLRQAAVAAALAGDTPAAEGLCAGLAASTGAPLQQARDVVTLTATMYRAPSLPAQEAAEDVLNALLSVQGEPWQSANALDTAAAACLNNIASALLERPRADLQHGALRAALDRAAIASERLWLRAGTWVHHERAAYLRAMVATALGEPHRARHHALRALALLDQHDTANAESVDRAFIELEHAHACARLGLADEARAAQAAAQTLADAFGDAGLSAWFDKRRAELATKPR